MGRLAVRLCIGGGLLATLLQFTAIWLPFMEQGSFSIVGAFAGYPMITCTVGLTDMEIKVQKIFGIQDIGKVVDRNTPAEWKAERERKKEEEEKKALEGLSEEDRRKAIDEGKVQQERVLKFREFAKQRIGEAYQDYTCSDGRSWCIKIPLSKLATLFSNTGFQMFQTLLPSFPGSHNTAQYYYWGGLTTLLFSCIICLVNLLGCGYLYYYAEMKATKTARKGALISFIASPIMAILIVFLLIGVVVIAGSAKNSAPWTLVFSSQSQVFPRAGFWIVLFTMIMQWMLVVFSRFWRMKRAERVRKQRKDEEEEEEFMRLMGIDPQAAFEDSSSDEEDSSSDEDDDMETATQRSSQFTPSTGVSRPQVIASQPVYGYNTVQPQVVQVGGNQPNVQRVYL